MLLRDIVPLLDRDDTSTSVKAYRTQHAKQEERYYLCCALRHVPISLRNATVIAITRQDEGLVIEVVGSCR